MLNLNREPASDAGPAFKRRINPAAIAIVGVMLWFSIDSLIWWLRPSLPASSQSLDGLEQQIASERGIEALPTLSPDGDWIAYRSDAQGTGDIYIRRIGTDIARNLTQHLKAEESDPAFSPDGRQIAFRSTHQNGGLYLMNRDGTAVQRLTNFGASPAWTPDGKSLVFGTRSSVDPRPTSRPTDGWIGEVFTDPRAVSSEGWIVNIASRAVARLTRRDYSHDFRQPSVSPDGKRVAYWSMPQTGGNGNRRRSGGIWTVGIDGNDAKLVMQSGATDWSPVWSPDGAFLYYLSERGGRVGVWRVSMQRSSGVAAGQPVPMALSAERAAALTISRQGRHLAWSTAEWSPTILRIDYDSDTRSTKGSPVQVPSGSMPLRCAHPSPDGSLLAIASDHQQPDVYVVNTERGNLSAVTTDAAVEGCPRWSPDGSRIAFHSDTGGSNKLWIANADGTGLRLAASISGDLTNPVWSPDGRSLVAWHSQARTLHLFHVAPGGPSIAGEQLPPPPHYFTPIAWSPDGSQIAGTATGALWVFFIAKRTYERLAPAGSATWLSSARRIIYASEGRLILLDIPSRFTREILTLPDMHLDSPVLTAGDRRLFFSRNAPEANVWVVELR